MKNHIRVSIITAFGLTGLLLLPLGAQADVKIERVTHFGGFLGMGANDTTSTDYLQGLKKRDESTVKFTGSVLGALQRFKHGDKGSQNINIMRVDQNLLYSLDPDDKTYTQQALNAPAKQGKPQSGQTNGQQQDNDTKITKNEFTVKATGEKKTINGFDTSEYLITWDLETENTKTGEKGKSLMTTDLWTADDSKLGKARDEELAYAKAYLKLLNEPTNPDELKLYGFGVGPGSVTASDSKAFFDKLRTIKGFPVSVDVTWKANDTGQQNGGQSGGNQQASPQDLSKTLGSLFGSKKDDDSSAKSSDGMTVIFTSHTEIKSVDTGSLDSSLFEVPTDYKKD
ncbi:MAG TPA: hypothetical protein VFK21_00705 [Gammaproteobacteria bacterium]|nr:hypothetical protein [Gammaproteobacteria bacterium]